MHVGKYFIKRLAVREPFASQTWLQPSIAWEEGQRKGLLEYSMVVIESQNLETIFSSGPSGSVFHFFFFNQLPT